MSDNENQDAVPEPKLDISDVQNLENDVPQGGIAAPTTEITLDEILASQVEKEEIIPQKNKKQIMYAAAGIAIIILLMMVYSMQPRKGPMGYAICAAFLELNVDYPHTLNITGLEGSVTAIRIYFSNINSYGAWREEMLECTFASDEKMGMKLSQVTRNRRAVDQKKVDEFNVSLPAIISSDPYRLMPPEWRNPLLGDEPPMQEIWQLPDYILNR